MMGKRKRTRGTTMENILQSQVATEGSLQQNQLENASRPQLQDEPQKQSNTTPSLQVVHNNAGNSNNNKGGRGPAQMPTEWGSGTKLEVQLNELGDIIGKDVTKVTTALGCLARNGVLAPLTYQKWTDLPFDTLQALWDDVEVNTTLPPEAKAPVLKKMAVLWRNWKSHVKITYFEPNKDNEEYFLHVPDDRLELSQWKTLVAYWKQENVQAAANRNKDNRSLQQFPHRTGRTSFGVLVEQMKSQGKDVGLLDVWIESRSRGKGIIADDDTATTIAQFKEKMSQVPESECDNQYKEKIFIERMGHDTHGRVRFSGKSIIPAKKQTSPPSINLEKMHEEVVQLVRHAVKQEKEEMQANVVDQIREEITQQQVQFHEKIHAEIKECLEFMNLIMAHVDPGILKRLQIPAIFNTQSNDGQVQDTSSSAKLVNNSTGETQTRVVEEDQQLYDTDSPYELNYKAGNGFPDDVFDFSPIKIGTRVHLLCYQIPKNTVAEGIVVGMDPKDEVAGVPLGPDFYKVLIKRAIDPNDYLMRPQRGVLTVGEAVNKCVAWHSSNVMEK